MLDSLPARLAVQLRTFEAGSLDVENVAPAMLRDMGQDPLADIIEAIEADEIQHVRFGNDWVKRLTAADPRAVLRVAAAMAWLQKVVNATGDDALKEIVTIGSARQLAGFSQGEVDEVARLQRTVLQRSGTAPGDPR
jgi:uncharacterized ferritin-like protein (DUF455 family)